MSRSGVLLLITLLTSCGKKGPPQLPLNPIPLPPANIEVRQQGETVLFRWRNPSANADGSPIQEISRVDIFELEAPRGASQMPPEAFSKAAPSISSEAEVIVRGDIGRANLKMRSFEGSPAVQYIYALRVITAANRESPLSRLISFRPAPPPPPPHELHAQVTPESIDICWEASASPTFEAHASILGYNVYRDEGTGAPWLPQNRMPIQSTCFQDRQFRFGARYAYRVRAVLSATPHLIESRSSSPPLEVQPEDRFPPPPPTNLRLTYESPGVRLLWYPSSAHDLAGYIVYRRQEGIPFLPLNSTPILEQSTFDTEVEPGATYVYRVSAVDSSPLQNESSPSPERTIVIPVQTDVREE